MDFDELITKLKDEKLYAQENFIPIIRDDSSRYLFNFVRKNDFKKILEIGTAIGYSGSIMLTASNCKLYTVDINEKSLSVAKNTFQKLGLIDRVNVFLDDAKNVIEYLLKNNEKFDMIFLDGAKGQYIYYLDGLTKILNDGGYIFADNVLLQGMVESCEKIPHRKRTMVVNLRKYLEKVNSYPYETFLLRIEDGIAITKVKR
jgi:caffeoyl-CoA O-methyltransferase